MVRARGKRALNSVIQHNRTSFLIPLTDRMGTQEERVSYPVNDRGQH